MAAARERIPAIEAPQDASDAPGAQEGARSPCGAGGDAGC